MLLALRNRFVLLTSFLVSDEMSADGDIASVMGFSGFGMFRLWCPLIDFKMCCLCQWLSGISLFLPGKKARTFDLEAIFEQTRRTAIERSQHVLGRLALGPVVRWGVLLSREAPDCQTFSSRGAPESPWAGRRRWKLHICPVLSSLSERKPCSPSLQVIWCLIIEVNVTFQF